MKKIISSILISLFAVFSFAQSISYLSIEDRLDYLNKPLFIISTSCDVEDVNGKTISKKTSEKTYIWIDWNKKIMKSISYNNLSHPSSYYEEQFNNDGLIVKRMYKSSYGEGSFIYEYSSDYSNFTQYEIKDSKKEKYIYGEYVKENDSYVYYEYEYEDGEITEAYKITGPGLSGSLKKYSLNATQDNPILRYTYEDGELTEIRTTYGNDYETYETSYSKDEDPVYFHRIYDKNKNLIYSKSTSKWGGEYKYVYVFDKFGNSITDTSYEINKDFGIEYLKPRYSTEYEYFYAPDSKIFEPSIPDLIYPYYEEPEDPTPTLSKETTTAPVTSVTNSNKLWEKAYYVDNFGDYTSTSYLRLKERLSGTFSNSATTNARLKVQFLIDSPEEMAIKLYEYDTSEVKGYYSDASYYIYIKDEAGDTHLLTGKNSSDRIVINSKDCLKLHKLFLENTTLKFHISYENNTSYNFTIVNDASYAEYFSK